MKLLKGEIIINTETIVYRNLSLISSSSIHNYTSNRNKIWNAINKYHYFIINIEEPILQEAIKHNDDDSI